MNDKNKKPKRLSDAEKAAEKERRARQHDFYLTRGGSTTPIALSSIECRVMYALFAFISRPEELERDDVRRKLSAPFDWRYDVIRYMPIECLTRMIYDSNRERERETIWKALYNLANTYRHFKLSDGTWYIATLIHLEEVTEDLDRPSCGAEIVFGSIFFDGLDSRYAPIHPPTRVAPWHDGEMGRIPRGFLSCLGLGIQPDDAAADDDSPF